MWFSHPGRFPRPEPSDPARGFPMPGRPLSRLLAVSAALAASPAFAGPPNGDARAALVGKPTELVVTPKVTLSGPRDVRQLVVTGKYADGSVRDLTWAADASADKPDLLTVAEGLFLRGAKNGAATLT